MVHSAMFRFPFCSELATDHKALLLLGVKPRLFIIPTGVCEETSCIFGGGAVDENRNTES